MSALDDLFTLDEIERRAVEAMAFGPRMMVQGAAGDGSARDANRAAWQRLTLRPRVLADVARRDMATTIVGQRVSMPLLVAPTGMHGLLHGDGECATAAAVRDAGTLLVLSMSTMRTIEDVAATGVRFWFQCYWGEDRERLRDLLQLAASQGCSAICLTVDMPVRPFLSAEMRAGMNAIGDVRPPYMQPRTVHTDPGRAWEHDARLTWDDLAWLRAQTDLPLVLKGVLTAEDALRALQSGVDAIIVSNHGGRTLDAVSATADALPAIAEAIDGRMQILIDGGIRSGADIARALALGASAALIGRPVLWGLQLGGADGVGRVLDLLRAQLDSTMGFLGAPTLAAITRDRVAQRYMPGEGDVR